ncbi:MAG: response regulator [Labilithrix sp.]|nr:response regulator [Labilithrix sp.]MCW5835696.1 response regulator [Labilithrix sp.]
MSLILVVEDHPMNRLLVRDVLENRGHEIIEACSVGDAERALAARVPDLVLLDIQIPGGGGEAVLRSIRGSADTAHLPVVAVTAFAMAGDRARLLAAGFDGYVSKPIDTREFGPTVEAFLRSERR